MLVWPAAAADDRVLPVAVDRAAADEVVELRQGLGRLHVPTRPDVTAYAWNEALRLQLAPVPSRLAMYSLVEAELVVGADPYSFYERGFDVGYAGESGIRLVWLEAPSTGTLVALRVFGAFRRGAALAPSAFVADATTAPGDVAQDLVRGPILDVLLERSTGVAAGVGLSMAQALGPCGLQASAALSRGAVRRTTWVDGRVRTSAGPSYGVEGGVAFDVRPDAVPLGALVEVHHAVERSRLHVAHDLRAALALVWTGPGDLELGVLGTTLLPLRSTPGSLVTAEVRLAYRR